MPYKIDTYRHGWLLFNPNDMYVGRSIDLYGEFAPGEIEMCAQHVTPDSVVVEVGANIGSHTVWLGQHAETVYAFEPQRLIFQMLNGNLALNEVFNVHAINAAVGDESGAVSIPLLDPSKVQNFGGLSALQCKDDGETVPVITIDDLGLNRCDFIKIEAEGNEAEVLRGAKETLARCRPTLLVEDAKKDFREGLHAELKAHEYEWQRHDTPMVYQPNYRNNEDDVFPKIVREYLICQPKAEPKALVA